MTGQTWDSARYKQKLQLFVLEWSGSRLACLTGRESNDYCPCSKTVRSFHLALVTLLYLFPLVTYRSTTDSFFILIDRARERKEVKKVVSPPCSKSFLDLCGKRRNTTGRPYLNNFGFNAHARLTFYCVNLLYSNVAVSSQTEENGHHV